MDSALSRKIQKLQEKVAQLEYVALHELISPNLRMEIGDVRSSYFVDDTASGYAVRSQLPVKIYGFFHLLNQELSHHHRALTTQNRDEELRAAATLVRSFKHTDYNCDAIDTYQGLCRQLAGHYELNVTSFVGPSPYHDAVLDAVLRTEHVFAIKAKDQSLDHIGKSAFDDYSEWTERMQLLYAHSPETLIEEYVDILNALTESIDLPSELSVGMVRRIPSLKNILPGGKLPSDTQSKDAIADSLKLKQLIVNAGLQNIPMIVSSFYENKKADAALYFTLAETMAGIAMVPQRTLKEEKLEVLVGYDEEKKQLTDNVELLLTDEDANHVFIHGPPGVGKSAMINGLLTEYSARGLRVLEVPREAAPLLSHVFEQLATSPHKYIVLIDEFSIKKDGQAFFDTMKKMTEGSFFQIPKNARFHIISNDEKALNLGFADKPDAVTASLEDRFGLVLNIGYPSEEDIPKILTHYASQKGVSFDSQLLADLHAYADKRKIKQIGGRNIRDFARTLKKIKC